MLKWVIYQLLGPQHLDSLSRNGQSRPSEGYRRYYVPILLELRGVRLAAFVLD